MSISKIDDRAYRGISRSTLTLLGRTILRAKNYVAAVIAARCGSLLSREFGQPPTNPRTYMYIKKNDIDRKSMCLLTRPIFLTRITRANSFIQGAKRQYAEDHHARYTSRSAKGTRIFTWPDGRVRMSLRMPG